MYTDRTYPRKLEGIGYWVDFSPDALSLLGELELSRKAQENTFQPEGAIAFSGELYAAIERLERQPQRIGFPTRELLTGVRRTADWYRRVGELGFKVLHREFEDLPHLLLNYLRS